MQLGLKLRGRCHSMKRRFRLRLLFHIFAGETSWFEGGWVSQVYNVLKLVGVPVKDLIVLINLFHDLRTLFLFGWDSLRNTFLWSILIAQIFVVGKVSHIINRSMRSVLSGFLSCIVWLGVVNSCGGSIWFKLLTVEIILIQILLTNMI